jgi:hypothetical protein
LSDNGGTFSALEMRKGVKTIVKFFTIFLRENSFFSHHIFERKLFLSLKTQNTKKETKETTES